MNFRFESKIYYWFLLLVVLFVLYSDIQAAWYIFEKEIPINSFGMMIFGLILKAGILFMLISKAGPVKIFIYLWAAMFVLSGGTGLIGLALEGVGFLHPDAIIKIFFVMLGMMLAIPAAITIKKVERDA